MHDTPGRLFARGLVHGLVEWSESRYFFYCRLRRRLLECEALNLLDDSVLNQNSFGLANQTCLTNKKNNKDFYSQICLSANQNLYGEPNGQFCKFV